MVALLCAQKHACHIDEFSDMDELSDGSGVQDDMLVSLKKKVETAAGITAGLVALGCLFLGALVYWSAPTLQYRA